MVLQETYLKKIDPGANFDAKAMAANQKTNSMETCVSRNKRAVQSAKKPARYALLAPLNK